MQFSISSWAASVQSALFIMFMIRGLVLALWWTCDLFSACPVSLTVTAGHRHSWGKKWLKKTEVQMGWSFRKFFQTVVKQSKWTSLYVFIRALCRHTLWKWLCHNLTNNLRMSSSCVYIWLFMCTLHALFLVFDIFPWPGYSATYRSGMVTTALRAVFGVFVWIKMFIETVGV